MNNWAILTINQTPGVTTEAIQVTTNNPCHLQLCWALNQPLRHRVERIIRGLPTPWGTYFCFDPQDCIAQTEAGDTLIHTFSIIDWPHCQTRYFVFSGTVGGDPSPSISAIYQKHHRSRWTVVLSALKDTWLNKVAPNFNFGASREMRVAGYPHIFWTWGVTIISFDTTFIPLTATIISADLLLSFFASNSAGNTHCAFKLIWNAWEEFQATFNIRKTGVPWAAGAISSADWVTAAPAGGCSIIPNGAIPWQVSFDVTAIVQDALDPPVNSNLIIVGTTPETGTVRYDSKEAIVPADRPTLTIVYE